MFNWFHKAYSSRYLNFHPLIHRRGVVYGLVDKILSISDPQFHQDYLKLIINVLLNNVYPLLFIFSTISKRLKSLLLMQKSFRYVLHIRDNKKFFIFSFFFFVYCRSINKKGKREDKKFVIVSYVRHVSKRFLRC